MQEPGIENKRTLHLLQVLRGVAAVMVVALHGSTVAVDHLGSKSEMWWSGAAGVDIFFVISGFVMALSSRSLVDRVSPGWEFMKRRLERIVPLYWIFTTLKVVLLLAVPALALRGLGSPWHLVASYLFLPSVDPTGQILPALSVGWTLNFEMLFYLLFAGALALKIRPLRFVSPILVLLVLVATLVHTPSRAFLSLGSPIVLEFLFGMLLYEAWKRNMRLPPVISLLLLVAGMVTLQWVSWGWMSPLRPFVWGLPAVAILTAAVDLEGRFGKKAPAWALALGDASYSIYLTHTFVLPFLGDILLRIPFPTARRMGPVVLLSILASCGVGYGVYRLIELPMIRYFQRRRLVSAKKRPATA